MAITLSWVCCAFWLAAGIGSGGAGSGLGYCRSYRWGCLPAYRSRGLPQADRGLFCNPSSSLAYQPRTPTCLPGSTFTCLACFLPPLCPCVCPHSAPRSFNSGDLTTCGDVILNYVETKEAVPWTDLRYLLGEVFYGAWVPRCAMYDIVVTILLWLFTSAGVHVCASGGMEQCVRVLLLLLLLLLLALPPLREAFLPLPSALASSPPPGPSPTLPAPPAVAVAVAAAAAAAAGGHVVDDQDRRLINAYLDELIRQELLPAGAAGESAGGEQGQQAVLELAPGFRPPPPTDYESMRAAIEAFPADSPALYAMHGNAQLSLLNSQTEALFQTLVDVGAAGAAAGGAAAAAGSGASGSAPAGASEAAVRASLADLLGRLPAPLNVVDIEARVKEKTPFVVVAVQVG